jgi:hypothetical protein
LHPPGIAALRLPYPTEPTPKAHAVGSRSDAALRLKPFFSIVLGIEPLARIVDANFSEFVNTVDLREQKNLLTAKDLHRLLVPGGPGATKAAAHFWCKQRNVLLDESGPIEILAVEHEWEFGHI